MKLLLDACVLYPTVMREVLLGAAQLGAFQPLYSARILEEWARAAARLNPAQQDIARSEIALMRAAFPRGEITVGQGTAARLYLPDVNDIHVLAAAIDGGADLIVTMNAKDFPRHTLREEGLDRIDPDALMCQLYADYAAPLSGDAARIVQTAQQLSGEDWSLRKLFKKARLPRYAKLLDRGRA